LRWRGGGDRTTPSRNLTSVISEANRYSWCAVILVSVTARGWGLCGGGGWRGRDCACVAEPEVDEVVEEVESWTSRAGRRELDVESWTSRGLTTLACS
jgi:hypothetical protein